MTKNPQVVKIKLPPISRVGGSNVTTTLGKARQKDKARQTGKARQKGKARNGSFRGESCGF